jgi:hypothetical protein
VATTRCDRRVNWVRVKVLDVEITATLKNYGGQLNLRKAKCYPVDPAGQIGPPEIFAAYSLPKADWRKSADVTLATG